MSSTVTSPDGTTIAFSETGTGPAVVIVDGATSHRQVNPTGQAVAEALADRWTVYTYDRRGRGESGDAGDDAGVRDEVDDIAALIEHAGGEAFLLGFSSGAVLALEAALAGLPITGLALYEAPFVISGDRPPVAPDYRERLQRAVADGRPGDAVAQFMTEAAGVPAEYIEPMRAEPFWGAVEQVAPTLAYDAAVMGDTMSGDPATIRRFAPITAPALVMHGGNSDAWMVAASTGLAGVLPNARHEVLPGQTHDVSADALAPVVAAWLETL